MSHHFSGSWTSKRQHKGIVRECRRVIEIVNCDDFLWDLVHDSEPLVKTLSFVAGWTVYSSDPSFRLVFKLSSQRGLVNSWARFVCFVFKSVAGFLATKESPALRAPP